MILTPIMAGAVPSYLGWTARSAEDLGHEGEVPVNT
eukprot:gene45517-368_t